MPMLPYGAYQRNLAKARPIGGSRRTAPPYAAPVQPQKKSRGWIVALVAVVLLFAFLFTALACVHERDGGERAPRCSGRVRKVRSIRFRGCRRRDAIDRTMETTTSHSKPRGLKAQLVALRTTTHIKAVVLRVNSGGGTATAGEMAAMSTTFRSRLWSQALPVNASAAYESRPRPTTSSPRRPQQLVQSEPPCR